MVEVDGGDALYTASYGGGGGGGRIAVWHRTPMHLIETLARTGIVQGGDLVAESEAPQSFKGGSSAAGGRGWADFQDPAPSAEEFSAPGSINFLRIVPRGTILLCR